MKRLLFASMLIAIVSLTACGAAAPALYVEERHSVGAGYAPEAPMPVVAPMEKVTDSAYIENVHCTLVVTDPKAKMDQMTALAQTLGGFVVSANLYQTYSPNGNQVPEGSIVIRVPANKLEEALKQVKADVIEIRNETCSRQDATQEYVDLESRLKNLQAANFSAISAHLIVEESIQPIRIGGWNPLGMIRNTVQSLINFLQDFVQDFVGFLIRAVIYIEILHKLLLIGQVIVLPIWLVYLAIRAIRRRSKKNKTETPPEPPAPVK